MQREQRQGERQEARDAVPGQPGVQGEAQREEEVHAEVRRQPRARVLDGGAVRDGDDLEPGGVGDPRPLPRQERR